MEEDFEFIPDPPDPNEAYVAVPTSNGFVAMTITKAAAYLEQQQAIFGVTELKQRVEMLEQSHQKMQEYLQNHQH